MLAEILTIEGYNVTVAGDGVEAIEFLESHTFELIITDCKMPGVGGLEVLEAAKRFDPRCPVIVTSGHPSSEGRVRLINHSRMEFLPKPFDVDSIRRTVAKLLET